MIEKINNPIEFKDIYGMTYYSRQPIDIEKIYYTLFSMSEKIIYKQLTEKDVFLLQIQTIELLSSMEKKGNEKAIKNLNKIDLNIVKDKDNFSLNEALYLQANYEYIKAHQIYTNLLKRNPKNRLAFFALHMLEFNLGWQKEMLVTSQNVVKAYEDKTDCFYGFAKGIEAFSLIENGFFMKEKKQQM